MNHDFVLDPPGVLTIQFSFVQCKIVLGILIAVCLDLYHSHRGVSKYQHRSVNWCCSLFIV